MRLTALPAPPVARPSAAPAMPAAVATDPGFGAVLQQVGAQNGTPGRVPDGDVSAAPAPASEEEGDGPVAEPGIAGLPPETEPILPLPRAAGDAEAEAAGPEAREGDDTDDAAPAPVLPPAVPAWFAALPPPPEAMAAARGEGPGVVGGAALVPAMTGAAGPDAAPGLVAAPPGGDRHASPPMAPSGTANAPAPPSEAAVAPRPPPGAAAPPDPASPPPGPRAERVADPDAAAPAAIANARPAPMPAGAVSVPAPPAFALSLSPRLLAGLSGRMAEGRLEESPAASVEAADVMAAGRPADIRLAVPQAPPAVPLAVASPMPQPEPEDGKAEADILPDIAATGTAPATPSANGGAAMTALPDTPRLPFRPMAVALAAHPGEQVELLLAPEELGRVRLVLHPSDGGVSVHVMADRPETLDLMRRNVAELAGELEAMGFGGASFAFGGDAQQDRSAPLSPPSATPAAGPTGGFPFLPAGMARPGPVPAGGLDLRL